MDIDYSLPTFTLYGPEALGWSYENPFDYSTLEWNLPIDKPTQLDLALLSAELYYEREVEAYKEARPYPQIADQLDKIFHEGVEAWKTEIQAIKEAVPKTTFDADELERRKQAVRDHLSS